MRTGLARAVQSNHLDWSDSKHISKLYRAVVSAIHYCCWYLMIETVNKILPYSNNSNDLFKHIAIYIYV
jgi:hypothetical protein